MGVACIFDICPRGSIEIDAVLGHAQQHGVFFGAAGVHCVISERLHEGSIDLRLVDRCQFDHRGMIVPRIGSHLKKPMKPPGRHSHVRCALVSCLRDHVGR